MPENKKLNRFSLLLLLTSVIFGANPSFAKTLDLKTWSTDDFRRIWTKKLNHSATPTIEWIPHLESSFSIRCNDQKIPQLIQVSGPTPSEQREQLYAAVFQMGFLFPHPRVQISPESYALEKSCGSRGKFKARLAKRGFHLHTMHPSEWVNGFLMNDLSIADDTIRWLVRNQQNVLQIQTLRTSVKIHLKKALEMAHEAGLEVGFSAAFALQQQKALYLVPLLATLTDFAWKKPLRKRLKQILSDFEFDYLSAEMGTTEFTSTSVRRTLDWMEETRRILDESGKKLFIKIHTSTGQIDPKYGNYNFIAQYSNPEVGVLPHTVMFYGLNDSNTPVYGRKNFEDVRDFMLSQRDTRPTWYYPETSYYVGMDIDVPIFLTDYFLARRDDYQEVIASKVPGHLTFTTGQELGYWLFDWNVALQAWPQAQDDPWLALRLLGEDISVWQKIVEFQKEYFNRRQVIRMISSSNLLDELPGFHPIHERNLIRDLYSSPNQLKQEIRVLEEALSALPSLEQIQNRELKAVLQVTWLRVKHALAVRKMIAGKNLLFWTDAAKSLRMEASQILLGIEKWDNRYPSSITFRTQDNVTSYDEGYGATALKLHFWEREEKMASSIHHARNPFFMNMYNVFKLLF